MSKPSLIAVDWGTTSCRAALVSHDGVVLETRDDGSGILDVAERTFEPALATLIAPWRAHAVPVILSGMIGSRQGWVEAPYVRCPAGIDDIAARLTWIRTDNLGRLALVPGLDTRNGAMPDVMRGEETQIIGAMGEASGVAVLPGTHSKWATVEHGRITGFRSYMTGEVFAALKDHTILNRLIAHATAFDAAGFERGVRDGAAPGTAGCLLNRVFATRTLALFDDLPAQALADYLSGLLIGAEIADNVAVASRPVTIIGNAGLVERYTFASRALGHQTIAARLDSAARGAFLVARAARLLM